MKTTLRELRSLIRNVLQEMPLAAISQKIAKDDPGEENTGDYYDRELEKMRKFHSSSTYKSKAESAFKFFKRPVYIIPTYSPGMGSSVSRNYAMPWEHALPIIKESDFEPGFIKAEMKKGAIVFVSHTSELSKGFLPTPWMILHALFDTEHWNAEIGEIGKFQDEIKDEIVTVGNACGNEGDYDELYDEMGEIMTDVCNKCLTMKSARSGELTQLNDVIAEILAQTTISRCVINPYQNSELDPEMVEEINVALQNLQDKVNSLGVRERLEEILGGKIVSVNVAAIF